tara:strand:- start:104 stop:538 length:435 start_codon:yes stop_codon:yes gene_type:complete
MKKNSQDFDFTKHLADQTKNYKGDYAEVLNLTAEIYYLCTIMVYNKDISQKEKNLLYKSIAYFLLPHDVYSESIHGPKGFLDDVMLCLYILNLISKRHIDVLYHNWTLKPSQLDKLLNEDFDRIRRENKNLFESVLNEMGIDND